MRQLMLYETDTTVSFWKFTRPISSLSLKKPFDVLHIRVCTFFLFVCCVCVSVWCLDAGLIRGTGGGGQRGVKSHKMSSWNVIFHSSLIQMFWVCGPILRLNITEMLRQAACHACCNDTLTEQNTFKGTNKKEWSLPFGLFSFREIEIEKLHSLLNRTCLNHQILPQDAFSEASLWWLNVLKVKKNKKKR